MMSEKALEIELFVNPVVPLNVRRDDDITEAFLFATLDDSRRMKTAGHQDCDFLIALLPELQGIVKKVLIAEEGECAKINARGQWLHDMGCFLGGKHPL